MSGWQPIDKALTEVRDLVDGLGENGTALPRDAMRKLSRTIQAMIDAERGA